MAGDLPDYYFRIRDKGASVFRVDTENRQRRIDMEEIALVNLRNGAIRGHGERALTPGETAAIQEWMARRKAQLAAREVEDIGRTVDHLNLTAHWAQSRATEAQLEEITDTLLLAMHDLRSVLVRKKAERLAGGQAKDAPGRPSAGKKA